MANVESALYILSPFDTLFERIGVVMGWLVEGTIDLATLDRALASVVRKWPMLAGRLEMHDLEGKQKLYRVRIPLSAAPQDYARYTLTSSNSPHPLSKYTPLPIPLASDSLPHELLKHPKAPTLTTEWITGRLPLLHWHVTWFDRYDDSGKKRPFSCIGVTFPHALFDGLGIARVVHAVEAELLGREWEPPSIELEPGVNKNLLESTLDRAADEQSAKTGQTHSSSEYHATGLVTTWWVLMYFLWAIWQEKWHGGRRRLLLIPAKALGKLEDKTRAAAAEGQGDKPENRRVQLTRGDILAAFVFKNTFCDGYLPPESVVSASRNPGDVSRTLCRYKTLFPTPRMQVANTVVAAGYLDDGTMVMDVYFVKRRLELLERAILKLVEEAEC
ncbi:hypothetical protein NLJ89_g7955 [Agrocybe chaxingu]|uniref:Uncharacterized protein n=1 Tax=Agrocybe chaxingu TaxID=84603 RepID=A0A9W8MUJ9_9AGAR|nr:hypothetical protein NLJ89_g7955 [Agrocybe chaxingu]